MFSELDHEARVFLFLLLDNIENDADSESEFQAAKFFVQHRQHVQVRAEDVRHKACIFTA